MIKKQNLSQELRELFKYVDKQMEVIGKNNIKKYRLCPMCYNYIEREKYDEHAQNIHGYTNLPIIPAKKEEKYG